MIKQYKDKKWLENKYWKEKLSTGQIGNLCGVMYTTIWKWLKKFNIPRRSRSEAHKGEIAWNKGRHPLLKTRIKMSDSWDYYKHFTKKTKLKISKANKGKNNSNWKGGISLLTNSIRTSFKSRQWRSDIFTRDAFTCQMCGDNRGGNLNAHHIKSFASILQFYKITTLEEALNCEELWNINNGITLCIECHKKTDNYCKK